MTGTPNREQAMDALGAAQALKRRRREVVQQMRVGDISPGAAAQHEAMATLALDDFVQVYPRWGDARTIRVRSKMQVRGRVTMADLTERQRGILLDQLGPTPWLLRKDQG